MAGALALSLCGVPRSCRGWVGEGGAGLDLVRGVQVLQMKVRRLEHLLQLKNVRIEDLSRRLQQAERKQR